MQNISKITFVILGAIIGAGFISGQEIYLFFNRFDHEGLVGIIVSGIMMGIVIKKSCTIIHEKNIKNYQEFLHIIIPIENQFIKLIINNMITIFLLISFWVMVAAINSYFKQEFQIPIPIIGIIIFLLCYFVLIKNSKAVIKVNEILIPVILIFVLFLVIKQNDYINLQEIKFDESLFMPILSGIIYSNYNTVLLIPILITLNKFYTGRKQINIISILCAVIIICMELVVYLLIYHLPNIENIEIPLICIANSLGYIYHYLYGAVIILAIFTTAIAVGHGFLKNVTSTEKSYKRLALSIGLISIFISYIGFAKLISLLYPIFGILGIIQIIFILKS